MDRVQLRPLLSGFLICVAFAGIATPVLADPRQGPLPLDPLSMGHSHNDYEQHRPLFDALEAGFTSVEADVFLNGDSLVVSHIGIPVYGTLEELYLDPLQALINQRGGSVYGDGRPMTLWIDLKGSPEGMAPKLVQVLSRYPMVSWFSDSGWVPNAVIVVLTGDETAKKEFVENYPRRPGSRDSNDFSVSDPPVDWRWNWYALDWEDFIDWNGKGSIPEKELAKLRYLLGSIHSKGRRVRFFDAPETDTYWTLMQAEGADLVSTDYLMKMRDYLLQHPVSRALMSWFSIK